MKHITDIPLVFASGIHCGIKADPSRKDLAYIYVPEARAAAGAFTRNAFRAPCITYSENCIKAGGVKAVVINSGNANAATGEEGYRNAVRTAEHAAKLLNLEASQVAVASTGIIGVQLPLNKLLAGLNTLLSPAEKREGKAAAEAIMTTDLCSKECFIRRTINGKEVSIAGMAKGSGMIAPNMGTMLAYLVIDTGIEQKLLAELFQEAVNDSFNMISVDSDTSTSDMALIFSTGEPAFDNADDESKQALKQLITDACTELAKMIARDGEGAEKLVSVTVRGARSKTDAKKVALNIINSPLVKTAIHGGDPNWGRVAMAVGKDPGIEVKQERTAIYFGSEQVLKNGTPLAFSREAARNALAGKDVTITVDLNLGSETATAWGCDLSKRYIDINVDYS